MTESEQQAPPLPAHWVVIDHIDRRINPLSERMIVLEVERRHMTDRMTSLEEHFKRHMEKEEEHWKSLCESIGSIKKTIARAVWLGTGGMTVLGFLWLFGKQVFEIWIKMNGG